METAEYIGLKIAELRKRGGCTQAELGAYLNISPQAISKWERGESCPDFDMLCKIADFFVVPLTYFQQGYEGNIKKEVVKDTENKPREQRKLLGVCQKCGKVVYEGDLGDSSFGIICKVCKKWAEVEEAELRAVEAEIRRGNEKARRIVLSATYGKDARNRGLIWGAVISAILIIPSLILTLLGGVEGYTNEDIPFLLLGGVMFFTFIVQLFWPGIIRQSAVAGLEAALDIWGWMLDDVLGFLLIPVLAPLGLVVLIAGEILGLVIGLFISIFTFLPAFIKMSKISDSEEK